MRKKKLWRFIRLFVVWFFILSIGSVILFRFVPVYFTPLMGIRCVQQLADGKSLKLKHDWVSLDEMSRHMPMAVIASEDNRFAEHHGFDFVEIKKAIKERESGKRKRGASTISQQTAKNVFCFPSRTWLRKGFEAYYTVLIECCWSKRRIMETYLNVIETGRNMYGVEAPAREVYGKSAKELNRYEASMIATVLPNPLRMRLQNPSNYMVRRAARVRTLMNMVGEVDLGR